MLFELNASRLRHSSLRSQCYFGEVGRAPRLATGVNRRRQGYAESRWQGKTRHSFSNGKFIIMAFVSFDFNTITPFCKQKKFRHNS